MRRAAIALTLAVASTAAAAQAYRCQTAGRTIYQQRPCEAGGSSAVVPLGRPPSAEDVAAARARADREAAGIARREAIASGTVFIGMSAADVLQAWGQPLTVNRTISAGRTSEQWVYRRPNGGAQYVYIDNGLVTSIQDRPGLVVQRPPAPCVDPITYQNAHVLSVYERTPEKMAELAKLVPCR